jgi:hypothetical protein
LRFVDVRREAPLGVALASLLSLVACSSPSNTAGESGASPDGGTSVDDMGDGEPTAAVDAPSEASPRDAGAPAGDVPAGKAGADAFCQQLCAHEQQCATAEDAAPAGLTDCAANCQTANEAATTNPPTELLRADYIDALGSCIARSSCDDPLQTSEASCAEAIELGDADAGVMALAPTQAAATFCHDLDTSSCFLADSGAPDCLSSFAFFSDVTLNAAISCFTDATCSAIVTCNTAAFTQP